MKPAPAGVAAALEAVIQTLWVGSLWTVGYLVAPALFAHFPDTATAGRVAGRLFTLVTWLGLGCAAALLLLMRLRRGAQRARVRLVLVMAGLLAASHFLVRPLMEAARLPDGTPGPGFGAWHGVSSLLYLAASLAGLALVIRAAGERAQAGSRTPGESGSGR